MARGRDPNRLACESLEKGLRRQDAARAVEGLLRLDPAARAPWLSAVAVLFRREVERLRSARCWAELSRWSVHARSEPRLVSEGCSADGAHEVRWILLWGSARGGRFEDAERWRAELAAGALETAQPLLGAVASWLVARGRPDGNALVRVALPDTDARLGRELSPPRRSTAAPTSELEAERAVVELLVASPWREFATTVSTWVGALAPAVTLRVGVVAGGLAVRELLRRLVAGEARALEPASLLADLVRALGAPRELAGEIVLAMRAVGASPASAVHDVAQARDLARLAGAAALYPSHRAWLRDAWLRMRVAPEAAAPVMALLEGWLREQVEAPLFFRTLELWTASRPGSGDAPPWLVEAARRLGHDGESLAAWLSTTRPAERTEALVTLVAHVPPDVAEGILSSVWQVAEPEVRLDVARAVRRLAERVRALDARPRRGWKSGLQRDAFLDFVAAAEAGLTPDQVLPLLVEVGLPPHQMREVMDLVAQVIASTEPSPAAQDLWRRWQERLVPLHPTYLSLALRHAASPEAARAVARSCLAMRSGPEGCLDVAAAVDDLGPHPVAGTVLTEMLTPAVDDPAVLATILGGACERGLGVPIQKAIARALLLAAGAPARRGSRPPEVEAALALARELVGPERPHKPSRGRGRRKRREAAEPAPGAQLPIFGKGST